MRGLSARYQRPPADPALLQQVVRDLAAVFDGQTAELDATKARPTAPDAEIKKLQLFIVASVLNGVPFWGVAKIPVPEIQIRGS